MPSKVHRVNTTIMCTGPSLCKNYWNFVNICPGNLLEICSVGFVYRGLEYVFLCDDGLLLNDSCLYQLK